MAELKYTRIYYPNAPRRRITTSPTQRYSEMWENQEVVSEWPKVAANASKRRKAVVTGETDNARGHEHVSGGRGRGDEEQGHAVEVAGRWTPRIKEGREGGRACAK